MRRGQRQMEKREKDRVQAQIDWKRMNERKEVVEDERKELHERVGC